MLYFQCIILYVIVDVVGSASSGEMVTVVVLVAVVVVRA